MANIARLPYDAAIGAEIDRTSNTAVLESAGGMSGRSTVRQAQIRQFHLTVGPDEVDEVRKIHETHRRRWPVAVRDWGRYKYADEDLAYIQDTGSTFAPLRMRLAPATGTRFLHQRILIPDEFEVPTVVTVDSVPLLRSDWTFTDFGIVTIDNSLVPTAASIRASGRCLVAACFVEDSLTEKVLLGNPPLLSLPDVRLREIPEPELIALMAQPDDSI